MIYFADLHIHSRFSRATSPDCNFVELARWAALKGIRVLATGDFTHPEWSREIKEMLELAEGGLFRLRKEFVPQEQTLPAGFGPDDVRFLLNVEISSIYKKSGATRKVHNLVFMPDLDSMDRFNVKLDRIGNLKSDGRPILGLDSRHLLEIALETSPDSFLVPAHVWTPWFSILGSRSGFDSVEECFDDLTSHVFALETGLSSDPEMNHRVGSLDRYTLISNSDTHSPANLGRECNIFEGEATYEAIRDAIREGGGGRPAASDATTPMESVMQGRGSGREAKSDEGVTLHDESRPVGHEGAEFIGTIEFFPEEGKYHLDGHRKCSARLDPEETARLEGKCPVCGQPVTVGVMNRVMELADKAPGESPPHAAPFWRMVPLVEIVAQALGVGPQSKKVRALHRELLRKLGPELSILWALPLDQIAGQAPEIITEGISRVRKGEVSIQAGYDGEYGKVELFTQAERKLFGGQTSFMPVDKVHPTRKTRQKSGARDKSKPRTRTTGAGSGGVPDALNEEQAEAITILDRPVLVKAGPGTGKTRTLVHRAAALIRNRDARPGEIAAVTFTRKAAGEMRERLAALMPTDEARRCWVGTFHQLGGRILDLLREIGAFSGRETVLDRDEALRLFRAAVKESNAGLPAAKVMSLFNEISLLKQNLVEPGDIRDDEELSRAYKLYENQLTKADALDLDDLLTHSVRLLRDYPVETTRICENLTRHLLVDEFQDVNKAQYEMVRLLGGTEGKGLFAIGDPDQAIYGFRGADWRFFLKLREDYPLACEIGLTRNYRSQPTILKAAYSILGPERNDAPLRPTLEGDRPVQVVRLPNAVAEGMFITRTIESMLGGSDFLSFDSGQVQGTPEEQLAFEDFAVLYRLNAVGDALEEVFQSSGIPFQRARKETPEEEAEARDPRAKAVSLMTIHASKGLEFPVVFLAGCEEGLIPYFGTGASGKMLPDQDEERRLFYVAVTRTAKDLFLTSADRRSIFGRSFDTAPSPFLQLIERSLCRFLDPSASSRTDSRKAGPVQGDLFR